VSKLVELDNAVFRREVLESSLPVLVDFTAAWCAPCRAVDRSVASLAREYAGALKVGQIDADANLDIVSQFAVQGLPALLLFQDGEELGRTGAKSTEALKRWIDEHLERV
jgi:thioredoxin 1